MPEFKLMIGLLDDKTGDILWSSVSSGNLSSAISEWEAIRAYMEEGQSVLPPLQTDELEEGSVAFFHLCRRTYRKEHSYLRYLWGFITIQLFSGWTLPCYISGWVNKRPKAGFPREVLDWSKPLPAAEHGKPSQELIEESLEIRKCFAKGQKNHKTQAKREGGDRIFSDPPPFFHRKVKNSPRQIMSTAFRLFTNPQNDYYKGLKHQRTTKGDGSIYHLACRG
jgi:hypothetical protein